MLVQLLANSAAVGTVTPPPGFINTNPESIVATILDLLFLAAIVLAVAFIMIGGIKFVTAGGDASKVKAAQDTIIYSVIGLVVAILARVIVAFLYKMITGQPIPTQFPGGGGGGGGGHGVDPINNVI